MQRAGQQIRRFANNCTGEIFELLEESVEEVVLLNMSNAKGRSINARTLNEPASVLRKYYTEVATNARYATDKEAREAFERVRVRRAKAEGATKAKRSASTAASAAQKEA